MTDDTPEIHAKKTDVIRMALGAALACWQGDQAAVVRLWATLDAEERLNLVLCLANLGPVLLEAASDALSLDLDPAAELAGMVETMAGNLEGDRDA